jgi:20S proteasome subunit beta 1
MVSSRKLQWFQRLPTVLRILWIWIPIIAYSIEVARGRSPDFSPSSYQYHHPILSQANSYTPSAVDLGTTLVAIKYNGGAVVGADTRTSVGGYVSNKLAYKINIILSTTNNNVQEEDTAAVDSNTTPPRDVFGTTKTSKSTISCVLCRSGSAADTQWVTTKARHNFLTRQLERPNYVPSISQIAHYIRHCLRESSEEGSEPLQASLICAGYDGKARIFCITPGGSIWEENSFCVSGSGSTVLLGYLDALDDKSSPSSQHLVSTKQEAIALVTKLLQLSIARDGSSGGLLRILVVNLDGVEELTIHPTSKFKTDMDNMDGTVDLKGFSKPVYTMKNNLSQTKVK